MFAFFLDKGRLEIRYPFLKRVGLRRILVGSRVSGIRDGRGIQGLSGRTKFLKFVKLMLLTNAEIILPFQFSNNILISINRRSEFAGGVEMVFVNTGKEPRAFFLFRDGLIFLIIGHIGIGVIPKLASVLDAIDVVVEAGKISKHVFIGEHARVGVLELLLGNEEQMVCIFSRRIGPVKPCADLRPRKGNHDSINGVYTLPLDFPSNRLLCGTFDHLLEPVFGLDV